MQDSVAAGQSPGGAWGAGDSNNSNGQPIVTLAMLDPMLQCQMCSQRFSMSGKLSDHRTPVLAVNPSHSIEGPYCIACAGKRDGLRSFQIDEARVALCKLWHQQLSMGAAYAAYVNQHQQAHAVAAMAAAHAQAAVVGGGASKTATTTDPSSTSTTSGPPGAANGATSAVAADITRRMAQAKRDAPGLDASGLNGTSGSGSNTGKRGRASLLNEERTALAMPAGDEHRNGTYTGVLGQHPSFHQQQQQQLKNNNKTGYPQYFTHITTNASAVAAGTTNNTATSNNNKRQRQGHPYISSSSNIKTTWTEEEDAILINAVTTSQEQPFTRWSDLAHQLPGRVGKQIRDRWLNHLDPRIDRSPFTREEDFKLYTAYKKHGKRWVEISTKFFDCKRSENHVKNRWYSAAFKKFVRQEIGEDPFDAANNNSTSADKNNKTNNSNNITSLTTNNKRKKPAEEPPAIVEEKKEG